MIKKIKNATYSMFKAKHKMDQSTSCGQVNLSEGRIFYLK